MQILTTNTNTDLQTHTHIQAILHIHAEPPGHINIRMQILVRMQMRKNTHAQTQTKTQGQIHAETDADTNGQVHVKVHAAHTQTFPASMWDVAPRSPSRFSGPSYFSTHLWNNVNQRGLMQITSRSWYSCQKFGSSQWSPALHVRAPPIFCPPPSSIPHSARHATKTTQTIETTWAGKKEKPIYGF